MMAKTHHRRHGLTLLELMITMLIMSIMASIAIPAFKNYQLNSKRAEAFGNLAALSKTEKSHYAEFGSYVEALAEPMGAGLGPDTEAHDSASVSGAFAQVGFEPEGDVYYSYDVVTANSTGASCASCTGGCFTASAYGDLDGDGKNGVVMYAQPDSQGDFCNVWLMDWVSPPIEEAGRVLSQVVRVDPFPGEEGTPGVDDY